MESNHDGRRQAYVLRNHAELLAELEAYANEAGDGGGNRNRWFAHLMWCILWRQGEGTRALSSTVDLVIDMTKHIEHLETRINDLHDELEALKAGRRRG